MKTLKEEIIDKMTKFLINKIKDMIEKKDFKSIYELENIKYGEYKILVYLHHITLKTNDVSIELRLENHFVKRKKINLSFINYTLEYGNKINCSEKTELGKIVDLYLEEQKKYKTLIEHKNMIKSLPDEERKNILRKRKFPNIFDDDDE